MEALAVRVHQQVSGNDRHGQQRRVRQGAAPQPTSPRRQARSSGSPPTTEMPSSSGSSIPAIVDRSTLAAVAEREQHVGDLDHAGDPRRLGHQRARMDRAAERPAAQRRIDLGPVELARRSSRNRCPRAASGLR